MKSQSTRPLPCASPEPPRVVARDGEEQEGAEEEVMRQLSEDEALRLNHQDSPINPYYIKYK